MGVKPKTEDGELLKSWLDDLVKVKFRANSEQGQDHIFPPLSMECQKFAILFHQIFSIQNSWFLLPIKEISVKCSRLENYLDV